MIEEEKKKKLKFTWKQYHDIKKKIEEDVEEEISLIPEHHVELMISKKGGETILYVFPEYGVIAVKNKTSDDYQLQWIQLRIMK